MLVQTIGFFAEMCKQGERSTWREENVNLKASLRERSLEEARTFRFMFVYVDNFH